MGAGGGAGASTRTYPPFCADSVALLPRNDVRLSTARPGADGTKEEALLLRADCGVEGRPSTAATLHPPDTFEVAGRPLLPPPLPFLTAGAARCVVAGGVQVVAPLPPLPPVRPPMRIRPAGCQAPPLLARLLELLSSLTPVSAGDGPAVTRDDSKVAVAVQAAAVPSGGEGDAARLLRDVPRLLEVSSWLRLDDPDLLSSRESGFTIRLLPSTAATGVAGRGTAAAAEPCALPALLPCGDLPVKLLHTCTHGSIIPMSEASDGW